jgi:ABC-type nitrate/sulfonate/bicarbonate transport system substrate-binding protein
LPNTAERILRRCTRSGFILGTLAASTLPARAQPRARIRIGVVPAETSAQAFYAKEMGFFANAGLDVDIHVFSSASLITSAVASNSIDVGWSSLVKIITAHARQIRLVAIAPASLYLSAAPNGAIFVAANSHIRSAKDLNNTVFAVTELGTISEYGSRAWIDRNGGSSASVLFAGMEDSTMFDALDHGLVDAAYFTEPSLGIAKKRERFLAYPYGSFAKDFLFGTWFTMSQWAKDYPDLVAKFDGDPRSGTLGECQPVQERRDPGKGHESRSGDRRLHGSRPIRRSHDARDDATRNRRRLEIRRLSAVCGAGHDLPARPIVRD